MGLTVGAIVGLTVGAIVGLIVKVGAIVGLTVGAIVGLIVKVGAIVGLIVGDNEGGIEMSARTTKKVGEEDKATLIVSISINIVVVLDIRLFPFFLV